MFRAETFLLVKPECANASFASTGKPFGWSDSMISKKKYLKTYSEFTDLLLLNWLQNTALDLLLCQD